MCLNTARRASRFAAKLPSLLATAGVFGACLGLVGCDEEAAETTVAERAQPVLASRCGLPHCQPSPNPKMAKFKLGRASAVRWRGRLGCEEVDMRTGLTGGTGRVQVAGEVHRRCHGDDIQFAFIYRQHTSAPMSARSWTTAFLPVNNGAAYQLLRTCTGDTTPEPSAVLGRWWRANNTYAENLLLSYISPVGFASGILSIDDDFTLVGTEMVDGVEALRYSFTAASGSQATVWLSADGQVRPLKLVDAVDQTDLTFTDWGESFAADLPQPLHELGEVCELNRPHM